MDLKHRVVLVTGSSSGIGRETAVAFARKGCNVAVTYNRKKEEGERVFDMCANHGDALLIHLDVTDDDSLEQAHSAVVQKWGRIDVLVNNAGVAVGNLFVKQSKEDIETQVNVNLLGLMKVTRAFLPQFYSQGEGIIINVGSTAGKKVLPGMVVYSATKSGVDAFTAGLAQELPPKIRVYCVYPGTTATRMTGYGGKDPAKVAEIIVKTAEETLGKKSGDSIYVERFLHETMKVSEYNVFFPYGEDYILFNTLRGSMFVVGAEVKNILEKKETAALETGDLEPFKTNGVLVDSAVDEKTIYRSLCDKTRSDAGSANFHLITTYQCNLSCVYCQEEGDGCMDEKTAQCAVDFARAWALKHSSERVAVELAGGEPLGNMSVNALIAEELYTWCDQTGRGFSLRVLTNGTLLTPDTIETLAAYQGEIVTVLDGPREVHDQRRVHKNGKGTFDEVVAGLHRAIDGGMAVSVRINVDRVNRNHVIPLLEFLKDEKLHTVRVSLIPRFSISPACRWNPYCPPYEEGLSDCVKLSSAAQAMNVCVDLSAALPPRGVCAAQKPASMTIDPYARLYTCALLPPSEKNAAGTLSGDGSPAFNRLYSDFLRRDPLTIDECRDCAFLPACGGGCPARALETTGTICGKVCCRPVLSDMLREYLIACLG